MDAVTQTVERRRKMNEWMELALKEMEMVEQIKDMVNLLVCKECRFRGTDSCMWCQNAARFEHRKEK